MGAPGHVLHNANTASIRLLRPTSKRGDGMVLHSSDHRRCEVPLGTKKICLVLDNYRNSDFSSHSSHTLRSLDKERLSWRRSSAHSSSGFCSCVWPHRVGREADEEGGLDGNRRESGDMIMLLCLAKMPSGREIDVILEFPRCLE